MSSNQATTNITRRAKNIPLRNWTRQHDKLIFQEKHIFATQRVNSSFRTTNQFQVQNKNNNYGDVMKLWFPKANTLYY
ncbi:hypothetical protein C5167_026807 [Papaver somniferum]|nr:hypothetical protein C5167_026807 [Papaver somniferum]